MANICDKCCHDGCVLICKSCEHVNGYKNDYIDSEIKHKSDCAVYNEPAYPNGPCDCGAEQAANSDQEEGGELDA